MLKGLHWIQGRWKLMRKILTRYQEKCFLVNKTRLIQLDSNVYFCFVHLQFNKNGWKCSMTAKEEGRHTAGTQWAGRGTYTGYTVATWWAGRGHILGTWWVHGRPILGTRLTYSKHMVFRYITGQYIVLGTQCTANFFMINFIDFDYVINPTIVLL